MDLGVIVGRCVGMVTVIALCSLFVQRLAELLKSKKPEDLQEANRLIKNMVKEVNMAVSHALVQTF